MGSEQDRRALLAILLSLGIYLLWSALYAPKRPPPPEVAEGVTAVEPAELQAPVPTAVAAPALSETVPEQLRKLDLPGWTAVLHSANGAVRDLHMTEYSKAPTVVPIYSWVISRVTGQVKEGWQPYMGGTEPQRILSPEGALLLAGAGAFDDDGAGAVGGPNVYRITEADGDFRATRRLSGGLVVTKRYRPGDAPYTLDVEVTFTNGGDAPVGDLWVGVADRMEGKAGRFQSNPRPLAYVDGSIEHYYETEDLAGGRGEAWEGAVDWFGLGDRYFMAVLAPDDWVADGVLLQSLPGGRAGSFIVDREALEPGASRTHRFLAYLGPKNLDLLQPLGHELDEAVEFGMLGFFARPLLFLLKVFYAGVHNWGVAIIVLTFLVKLVFFPLTQKAFVSSRKMQAIQPQLQELKEKYKDNRELQTQETMKLMKDHGVNPMGGCLPTLIQLPVWFALYNTMLHSVELYDTSFLYLKDLTAEDPYGILPVVYILLMLAQQRMMPMTGLDPTQAKIFKLMPLFFGVMMFGFPSGLVLYFSVNMILTIAQQWFIKYQHPDRPVAAPAQK